MSNNYNNRYVKYYACASFTKDPNYIETKLNNDDLELDINLINDGVIEFYTCFDTFETSDFSTLALSYNNVYELLEDLYFSNDDNIDIVVEMFDLTMDGDFIVKYDPDTDGFSLVPLEVITSELNKLIENNLIDFDIESETESMNSFKMSNPVPLDYMKRFEDVVYKLLGDKFKHLHVTDGYMDSLITVLDGGNLFYGMCEYDHIKFPSTLYETIMDERTLSFIVLTDSKINDESFKEIYVFDVNFINLPELPSEEDFHHIEFEFKNLDANIVKDIYGEINDDSYVYCDLNGNRIMHLES